MLLRKTFLNNMVKDPNAERSMLSYGPFRIRVIFKVFHNWVLYHTL
jgi:hypothetical protein